MDGQLPVEAPLSAQAFAALMASFAIPAGGHVAVAVSGGADSLCLAFLLADWARARGVRLTALTVDHRLRAEARGEAEQVGVWLSGAGVAHHILTWHDGPSTTRAVQARARDARYALLADWCRTHGAPYLFVAHQLEDQAETFVMRLKRSSTLFGLAAMAPQRDLGGVMLCRPFLEVPKARLEATLRARGQAWIDDPSNTNPAFERVRTRALIAALDDERGLAARLVGAARAAQRVTEVLDRAAAAFRARHVRASDGGGAVMDRPAFADLPRPVAERVLSTVLRDVAGRTYAPRPAKVARLWRWLVDASTVDHARARTLGGCLVRLGNGVIHVSLAPPRRTDTRRTRFAGTFFLPQPLPPGGKSLTSLRLGARSPSGRPVCTAPL